MDWNDDSHWHNSGLWDLVRNGGQLERVINPAYAAELRHSQALLSRCGWGTAEHHANDPRPAVRLEENLPPVYSIAVEGE